METRLLIHHCGRFKTSFLHADGKGMVKNPVACCLQQMALLVVLRQVASRFVRYHATVEAHSLSTITMAEMSSNPDAMMQRRKQLDLLFEMCLPIVNMGDNDPGQAEFFDFFRYDLWARTLLGSYGEKAKCSVPGWGFENRLAALEKRAREQEQFNDAVKIQLDHISATDYDPDQVIQDHPPAKIPKKDSYETTTTNRSQDHQNRDNQDKKKKKVRYI